MIAKTMKHLVLGAAIIGTAGLPLAASAEQRATPSPQDNVAQSEVTRGDAASSDTTTMTGAQASSSASFDKVDTDRSGAVTQAEYVAYAGRQAQTPTEAKAKFKSMDKDGNGQLSPAEIMG